MELKTLEKLFVRHLKSMYSSEKQLIEAMPKLVKAVSHKDLKYALKEHFEQTKVHLERIQKILQRLAVSKLSNDYCDVIEALLDEADDLIEEYSPSQVLDTELMTLFQKIEHFEIASYNTLVNYAKLLAYDEASELLQQTLDEEYEADNKFDKLTEEVINVYIKS